LGVEREVSLSVGCDLGGVHDEVEHVVRRLLQGRGVLSVLTFDGGGVEGEPLSWSGDAVLNDGTEVVLDIEQEWWS